MPVASPTLDDIRAELDRVAGSEVFAGSVRLQRFLRHVVLQSVAGKGEELKEYAIGTAVFDRDEQYDPRIDSIVRVEAGRLRGKLDDYYNGPGAGAAVRIRIPRGTYAPIFEAREIAATASTAPITAIPPHTITNRPIALGMVAAAVLTTAIVAWRSSAGGHLETAAERPTVAVLPFAQFSTDAAAKALAARLTDGVTGELARIGSVGVVSRTSAFQFEAARKPLKEIAQALNADVVIEGSVDIDGETVHVQARLVDAKVDRKGWIQDFNGNRETLPQLQRQIAAAIERAVITWRTP